jgi:hypothetical protein
MASWRALFPILLLVLVSTESLPQSTAKRSAEALAALSACSVAMGALPSTDGYGEGILRRYFGKDNAEYSDERLVLKSKGTSKVRTEIGSEGDVYVVNGTGGHAVRAGTRGRMSSHGTVYFRPEHLAPSLCTLDLQRQEMSATYLGAGEVQGRSTFHVLLVSSSEDKAKQLLSELHLYIDQQTGVLVKTKSYVFDPDAIQNHSDWEVYYSDFRRIGTALIPHQIERFDAGQRHSTVRLSLFRTDVVINASEFE